MEDVNMANFRGKKLTIIALLIAVQFVCLFIGGYIVPEFTSRYYIEGTVCRDRNANITYPESVELHYYPDEAVSDCENPSIYLNTDDINVNSTQNYIYKFRMPSLNDNTPLYYSSWKTNFIGVLLIDVLYHRQLKLSPETPVVLEAELAYRDEGDSVNSWKPYSSYKIERVLDCNIDNYGGMKTPCKGVPLFELGLLNHDYYLLNIRLPLEFEENFFPSLNDLPSMTLTTFQQNGFFTKIWIDLKAVFFLIVLYTLIWYWRQVNILSRSLYLLEKMLLALGLSLAFLNMPFEYLIRYIDMPFMLFFNDIRQFIFYFVLMSFWVIFVGEHLIIQNIHQKNHFQHYHSRLRAIFIGCLLVFTYGMYQHFVQMENPFCFDWIPNIADELVFPFVIITGIALGCYLISLSSMILKIFIKLKNVVLPTLTAAQQVEYQGVIYRFKFISLATLLCAFLTLVGFIPIQLADSQWRREKYYRSITTSNFFIGIYGMWNVYTISLLYLYAPLNKKETQQQPEEKNLFTISHNNYNIYFEKTCPASS